MVLVHGYEELPDVVHCIECTTIHGASLCRNQNKGV